MSLRLTDVQIDLHRGEVRRPGGVVALTTREVELLTYLADRTGQSVSRDELHERVWGYSPQVRSRAVDFTVHRLRAKIESDPAHPRHLLKVHGVGYRLVLPTEAQAALPDGRATVLCGHVDRRPLRWHSDGAATAQAMMRLRSRVEALAMQHGATLSRTVPPLLVFRGAAGALAAAQRLADDDVPMGVGLATGTVTWWTRGDATEADGPAVARADVLARSWEPGHVIADEATTESLPDTAWRDLGAGHLHELPGQVRAYGLSPRAVAPPAATPGTTLRAHAEPLVGRRGVVADVLERLEAQGVVTLWGPGGAGKTRLARETALRWSSAEHAAWLCPLQAAGSMDEVFIAIGDAAGLPRTQARQRHALRSRGRVLLVLDCADALSAEVSEAVTSLAAGAPEARFLVTSRARPETGAVVEVGPLDPADARALLIAAARRRHPGFGSEPDTVDRIVAQVGRLPLALELVGACAALRSAPQLLKAVEAGEVDADIGATVAWSWSLLAPATAGLLARLSVFPSSFTLEDAEAVAGAPGVDTTEGIAQLRDQALLFEDDDDRTVRLALYDEVRAYARGRLMDAGGWEAAVQRHGARFVGRGTAHLSALATLGEAAAITSIGVDLPDLLCIVDRAVEAGDRALQARAVVVIGAVLLRTGPQSLLRRLIEPLVPVAEQLDEAIPLLVAAAGIARREGRLGEAIALQRRRLAAAEAGGDPAEIVFARAHLAHQEPRLDQVAQREAWVEALAAAGRPDRAASVCNHLLLDIGRRDAEQADRWVARGLELARQAGHRVMEACLQLNHGARIAEENRASEGAALMLRAARIDRQIGDHWGACASLANAGYTLVLAGEVAEGTELLRGAGAEADRQGNTALATLVLAQLGDVYLVQGRYPEARATMEAALERGRGTWGRSDEHAVSALFAALRWRMGDRGALDDLDRALHRLSKLRAVQQWRGVQACLLAADGRGAEARETLPPIGDDPRYTGFITLAHRVSHALAEGSDDTRAAARRALDEAPRMWHELRLEAYVGHHLP